MILLPRSTWPRLLMVAGLLALPAAALAVEATSTGNDPAGAPPAVRRLTLADARELALERNLQMALSFEQVEEARSVLGGLRAALGPSVALTGSQANQSVNLLAQGFPKPGAGPSLFPALLGPFNSFDTRLRFSQAIFDPVRSRLADAGVRQVAEAEHQRAAVAEQIVTAVDLGYIAVQQAVAALAAAEGNLALSRELCQLAQDQRDAGVATGVDVARAETRVAQDEFALAQARSAREQSLLRLKRVLGVPAGEALVLASALEFREVSLPTSEAAVNQAVASRQELQALAQRIAAAESGLAAAGAENAPVVTVEAGIGPSGSTPVQNVYLTRSIGIGVTVPLFTSGLTDAHRDRASSQLRAARLAHEDALRQVEEDVHLALLAVSTAAEQVKAARTSLALGERLLTLARDRFAQGVADNLEVLDALNSTTTARSHLIDAIAAHSAARANLEAALGDARSFTL